MAFIVCLLLVVCIKLWYVRNDEIWALEASHDDVAYLISAKHWFWGAPYTVDAFTRLPAYPLFIALVDAFGVPLRLATELYQLAGAAALVAVAKRLGVHAVFCVALFAALAMNPLSLAVNNRVTPDAFFTGTLCFYAASLASQFARPSLRMALVAGVLLGILSLTREEYPLVVGNLLVFTALSVCRMRSKGGTWGGSFRQAAVPFLASAGVAAVLVLSACLANMAAYGIFGRSEYRAPGMEAACKALASIRVDDRLPYVAIPASARAMASNVSPAYAVVEKYMAGPSGDLWRTCTEQNTGVKGEISPGWWRFAMRDAIVLSTPHGKSARDVDAYCLRIAAELNAAIRDGRLPGRWVGLTIIDPDIGKSLPRLPESLRRMTGSLYRYAPATRSPGDIPGTSATTVALFDEMANRRTFLAKRLTRELSGWAFCAEDPIRMITYRAKGDETMNLASAHARPDVRQAFPGIGNRIPDNCGFLLVVPVDSDGKTRGKVDFHLASGKVITKPFSKLVHDVIFNAGQDGVKIQCYLNPAAGFNPAEIRDKARRQLRHDDRLRSIYGNTVIGFSMLAGIGVVVMLVRRRWKLILHPLGLTVVLLGSVFGARLLLLTYMDVSAWLIREQRYFMPMIPIHAVTVMLLAYLTIRDFFIKESGEGEPVPAMPADESHA